MDSLGYIKNLCDSGISVVQANAIVRLFNSQNEQHEMQMNNLKKRIEKLELINHQNIGE